MTTQPDPSGYTSEPTSEPTPVPDSAQLELTRGETCVLLRYVQAGSEAMGRDPSTLFSTLHIRSKHAADVASLVAKMAKLGEWFITAETAAEDAADAAAAEQVTPPAADEATPGDEL